MQKIPVSGFYLLEDKGKSGKSRLGKVFRKSSDIGCVKEGKGGIGKKWSEDHLTAASRKN